MAIPLLPCSSHVQNSCQLSTELVNLIVFKTTLRRGPHRKHVLRLLRALLSAGTCLASRCTDTALCLFDGYTRCLSRGRCQATVLLATIFSYFYVWAILPYPLLTFWLQWTFKWSHSLNVSSLPQWLHLLSLSLSLSLILRPTVSRPVCLGIKHPSRAYDQIFITVRQLRLSWCGALSLTIGQVCHL
jgi:hypothetical protein